MRTRWLFFLAVVVIIGGVGLAMYRTTTPLPKAEQCTTKVADGSRVSLSTEQAQHATLIVAIAVRRDLPARAATIALATAYQESRLRNLAGGDRDSVGLFQQRPSMGWGTVKQIRTPTYAINKFYDGLVKVPNYAKMPITEAAQAVQRSAFPDAYAQHEASARSLASALTGYSAGGQFSCIVNDATTPGSPEKMQQLLTSAYGAITMQRTGSAVVVSVPAGPEGRRLGWSVAQFASAHAKHMNVSRIAFSGKVWEAGKKSPRGFAAGGGDNTHLVRIQMR